ncbi:CVNH domain-containing protein [Exophiala viscosa]|uniref:CVNH domain-containing protein n=1 Tax=Exophiala viscosa TaxID=2486360 RepID=UPI00219A9A55|nr:CVNH domain-containing protein [Exophiala viscosa]
MSDQEYWNNQRPGQSWGYGGNQEEQWQPPSGPPQGYGGQPYGSSYDQNRPYEEGRDYQPPYHQPAAYPGSDNQSSNQYSSPPPTQPYSYQQQEYSYRSQSYGYNDQPDSRAYSPNPQSQYNSFIPPAGPPPTHTQTGPYPPQPAPGAPLDPNDPQAQDRGLMGAVAGGALGAYGGHKLHHGFLGTIGGAIAGSMTEDAYKKHKKEKNPLRRDSSSSSSSSDDEKKKKKHGWVAPAAAVGAGTYGVHQYQQHPQQQPRPQDQPQQYVQSRGNFSASSHSITLDRDYDLIASCADVHGNHKLSSISLNNCLANEHGQFVWARGGNFGASARDVRLCENGKVLEAELGTGDGCWNRTSIRLDQRVSNNDGELILLD